MSAGNTYFNYIKCLHFCREYKKTDICIDALIGQCNAYDQFYYKAVEDSWDYICEDKKQGMFLCIEPIIFNL